MARYGKTYRRRSTSRTAASLLSFVLPAPLNRVADSQFGPILLILAVPALLIGLLQINWNHGIPHVTINPEKAQAIRNVAGDRLSQLDPTGQLEQVTTNLWNQSGYSPNQYQGNGSYPVSNSSNSYPLTQPNYNNSGYPTNYNYTNAPTTNQSGYANQPNYGQGTYAGQTYGQSNYGQPGQNGYAQTNGQNSYGQSNNGSYVTNPNSSSHAAQTSQNQVYANTNYGQPYYQQPAQQPGYSSNYTTNNQTQSNYPALTVYQQQQLAAQQLYENQMRQAQQAQQAQQSQSQWNVANQQVDAYGRPVSRVQPNYAPSSLYSTPASSYGSSRSVLGYR